MPAFGFRAIDTKVTPASNPVVKASVNKPKNGAVAPDPLPVGSIWQIFRIWLLIGLQSFGGGATTSLLIRREMVNKRGWFDQQAYSEMWALCNLAPGINLFAFAIIIGNRLARLPGAFACLLGMTLPSAIVTTLITAGFTTIQNWPPLQAMMHGIIPAIIGISFVFVVQFALPIIKQSWREGKGSLVINLVWAGLCAVLLGIFKLSAVLVLIASAIAGALILPRVLTHFQADPATERTETTP